MSQTARRSANLTISTRVLDDAKAFNINLSRSAEAGIAAAVAKEKARQWHEDNAEAIAGWNAYIEKNGLPLARYRKS